MAESQEIERPFPIPAPEQERDEWVEAVLATPGVNVPRDALVNIAPFVVNPLGLLGIPGASGRRKLAGSAVHRFESDAGDMTVVTVEMHGVGGVVWENNERISSAWHSFADPSTLKEDQRTQARVQPWTCVNAEGREEVFAALRSSVESREELISNINLAVEALGHRVGHRSYNLQQDLILNGQQEPCMFVAQHFQLDEAPLTGGDGRPLHPREQWGWMAVRGNNRTKERQQIFGVTSADVLAGVPRKRLVGEGEKLVFDASEWLTELSTVLNDEYVAAGGWDPDSSLRAVRAKKVAVVKADLVVGSTTPRRLYRIVQMRNRRDHVHPPLEFTQNDRGRALARSVLSAYVAAGRLDPKTADVLSGAAPITELPGGPKDATVSELRDLRSMMLLRELFPTERDKRFIIRRVLSESPPSQLSAPEVNRRARAWSALTSESYPKPWNPRIGEMFQAADVREGLVLSGRPLRELLAVADTDDDAFDELVSYRVAHWLAASDIVDADRGSLTGQKADGDETKEATRVRRTVRNTLAAFRNNSRRQAVEVLRELAAAMDQGDRKPLKVTRSGERLVEPMNRTWFNREFPKETGKQLKKPKAPAGWDAGQAPEKALPRQIERVPEAVSPLWSPGPAATPTGGEASVERPDEMRSAPLARVTAPVVEVAVTPTVDSGPDTGHSGLEHSAEELRIRIHRLLADASEAKEVLLRMGVQARRESVPCVFSRQQAAEFSDELRRTLKDLRELPELVEVLTDPSTA